MVPVNFWAMDNLTGWSNSSGWSIINGWATRMGDAFASQVLYRNSGLATHVGYYECEYWATTNGNDNWGSFAACWGTTNNAYNNDGFAWIVRGSSAASGPNNINPVTGSGLYTLPSAPSSELTAILLGIEVYDIDKSRIYVNRQLVIPSNTHSGVHSTKRNVALGSFYGLTARFRNVAVYESRPF